MSVDFSSESTRLNSSESFAANSVACTNAHPATSHAALDTVNAAGANEFVPARANHVLTEPLARWIRFLKEANGVPVLQGAKEQARPKSSSG
jgi:hypothetical protein